MEQKHYCIIFGNPIEGFRTIGPMTRDEAIAGMESKEMDRVCQGKTRWIQQLEDPPK